MPLGARPREHGLRDVDFLAETFVADSGNAEVCQDCASGRIDEHIVQLDVAVNDTFGVYVVDDGGEVAEPEGELRLVGLVRRHLGKRLRAPVRAEDEIHREIGALRCVIHAEVVHLDEAGVGEARKEAGLDEKAAAEEVGLRAIGGKQLEGNVRPVTAFGFIHLAHAAGPKPT